MIVTSINGAKVKKTSNNSKWILVESEKRFNVQRSTQQGQAVRRTGVANQLSMGSPASM